MGGGRRSGEAVALAGVRSGVGFQGVQLQWRRRTQHCLLAATDAEAQDNQGKSCRTVGCGQFMCASPPAWPVWHQLAYSAVPATIRSSLNACKLCSRTREKSGQQTAAAARGLWPASGKTGGALHWQGRGGGGQRMLGCNRSLIHMVTAIINCVHSGRIFRLGESAIREQALQQHRCSAGAASSRGRRDATCRGTGLPPGP